MKKIYTLLFAALLVVSASAQNATSYFMEGSVARSQWNPAFAPNRGYVNIPFIGGIQADVQGNIALDNFLTMQNGKLTTILNSGVPASLALAGLDDMNRIGAGAKLDLIGFGAYTKNKRNFWSVGVNMRVNADARAPYQFFDFVKNGNSGNFANLGMSMDSYIETSFSYSFPIIDKLYLGVRGKFLVGAARVAFNFSDFEAYMGADRWYAHAAGTLEVSGLVPGTDVSSDGTRIYNFDDMGEEVKVPAGYGFGVDIGATYDILPELQLSLSVNDLGMMAWSSGSSAVGKVDEDVEFTGVEIGADGETTQPSFDLDELSFAVADNSGLTKALRASVNAGAEYNILNRRIGFGLFYSAKFWEYKTRHNLTASVNFRPFKWLHASGSFSYFGGDSTAAGVALNICPGFINLFVATDLLLCEKTPQWVPIRQSNMNITFGLAVPLGRRGERHETRF